VASKVKRAAGALIASLALACAAGCGNSGKPRPLTTPSIIHQSPASGPAFGLTEDNADLLWSPDGSVHPYAAFQNARRELTALRPRYVRLLVDWAALQPDSTRPAALEGPVSGCARTVSPCGAYAGIRDELAAIASQQHAAGASGQDFQVVVDIFGTPAWAARAPSGCELARARSFSRGPRPAAIAGYRALIRSLLALAAREGVALEWWSPWNEPDSSAFVSPQRSSCAAGSQLQSVTLYTQLARAMAAELRADGGVHHLVLGELNALPTASPDRASISQFVAALPGDALCLGDVWSIHVYASPDSLAAPGPVDTLEHALDARGSCGRDASIWVTEAGAGALHPGSPRPTGASAEVAGCVALGEQLLSWYRDPRVGAVFQYTFREDPAYPVGLLSPDLSHVYPAYRLWRAWARGRATGQPPPIPSTGCA
jgi:hypothetical protein